MSNVNQEFNPSDVDTEILGYLNLAAPKSFLLFAGAGSGKTRTLVNVLEAFKLTNVLGLVSRGQKVAIITFTNAACEEIRHRLKHDPVFKVSTIHSFAWELISPFTEDTREWLRVDLQKQIQEIDSQLSKARSRQSKTSLQNSAKKISVTKRLENLDQIKSFSYSPSNNRPDKDSLNHAEVIKIATSFIASEPLMQKLLIKLYPILLIDESQDTNRELLDAFIQTQQAHRDKFSLGLFGDLMQRIYSGGKENLNKQGLPSDWAFPSKSDNFRCPKRVVELINKVRKEVDSHCQVAAKDNEEGYVRLFLVNSAVTDNFELETKIREEMASITGDVGWITKVKCLTLEHAMAAKRGRFDKFFLPLSEVPSLRDSVLTGESKTLRFLTEQLLPLADALDRKADFETMRILKKYSPLFAEREISLDRISSISVLCENLSAIVADKNCTILNIVEFIYGNKILECPEILSQIITTKTLNEAFEIEEEKQNEITEGWEAALSSPLEHLINYKKYLNDELDFGTHQGVKGLQFERVLAVMDDAAANGFLFGYEKLLGAEALSDTDKRNINEGKDSGPDRTRRLFYVICSRAEKSLALVHYTSNRNKVKDYMLSKGWFKNEEIIFI
ncbi:ATP-dependent helicase [Rheinheimera sediminis]|nr:ATP-dependent helicase [Rheinheimera sp. YQF-1]